MSEKEKICPDRAEKKPQKMLLEARDGLIACRKLFILSTLMLTSKKIKVSDPVFWIKIWLNSSLVEGKIAKELVARAKLQTGGFRTVPEVEKNVRKSGAEFIQTFASIRPKTALNLATAIVDPHIEHTKEVQKEEGVPENPSYDPLCIKKPEARKYTVFAGYGPTRREKVAC